MFYQCAVRISLATILFAVTLGFGCSKSPKEPAAPPPAPEPEAVAARAEPAEAKPVIEKKAVPASDGGTLVPDSPVPVEEEELSIEDDDEAATLVAGKRKIMASAVEATDDKAAYLQILVSDAKGKTSLRVETDLQDCEYVSARLDGIAKIDDKQLIMAQLFCENGEDEFNRDMVTTLIFTGKGEHRPAIMWQGKGHYGNSFGVCEQTDVVHFERSKPKTVSVFRTTSVVRHEKGADCKPKPKRKRLVTTVAFPPKGRPTSR